MLGNVAPLWETMLAAMKLGAVVIPATTLLTPGDLADRFERGRARHVVAAAVWFCAGLLFDVQGAVTRGPAMRPLAFANAASISSFSCATTVATSGTSGPSGRRDVRFSHVSSIENVSPSQSTTDRSMTFYSSRTFPGQS